METKPRIAVFAGTFDPPSNGHFNIIEKSLKIFDKIIVVVAENPNKKPMFNVCERLAMLTDFLMRFPPGAAQVEILPSHRYLAQHAYEKLGACAMIRSMRNNIDFVYEYDICRHNRNIEKGIETVYIMPDDAYSVVSSSSVKGLMGINGWRKAIKGYVSPYVLECLKKRYLKDEFDRIVDEILRMEGEYFSFVHRNDLWKKIDYSYTKERRIYHNVDHIIDGLESFREFFPDGHKMNNGEMLLAWILHDVDSNKDEAKFIARSLYAKSNLMPPTRSYFMEELIEATKHKTCKYRFSDESIFASIDLICLGLPPNEYREYWQKVFMEYFLKSKQAVEEFVGHWKDGRAEFLHKMLAREFIYPDVDIREKYEKQALENLKLELAFLNNLDPSVDCALQNIANNWFQNN